MKQIVERVRALLSRPEESVAVDEPSKPVSIDDLVIPDIYAEVNTTAKALDLSSPDSDKKRGFNPYDTGVLQKK